MRVRVIDALTNEPRSLIRVHVEQVVVRIVYAMTALDQYRASVSFRDICCRFFHLIGGVDVLTPQHLRFGNIRCYNGCEREKLIFHFLDSAARRQRATAGSHHHRIQYNIVRLVFA